VALDDCARATDDLLALLRGNLCLELALGVRAAPDADEMRAHAASAVALFLRGARMR
jgi:hypothetical protein